jgi:hypothetical protein
MHICMGAPLPIYRQEAEITHHEIDEVERES